MTKDEIAAQLCNRIPDMTKSMALHAVEGLTEVLSEAFTCGKNIYLRGFGSFEVKTTKVRKARNINDGTTLVVPAQRTVKFKISKQLKKLMNNGTDL